MGVRGVVIPAHLGDRRHKFQEQNKLFRGAIPATLGTTFAPAIRVLDRVGFQWIESRVS